MPGKKANRTVLVITDFSKSSSDAILFVANLFQFSKLKLVLLNAYETPGEKATLLISVDDILTKDSETGLKKQSETISSAIKGRDIEISTYSIGGKLKYSIGKVIQSENIDLVVTGIPKSKYPLAFLNNNPILFMGQSRYPVLLVPEECPDGPIKNILILNLDPHQVEDHTKKGLEHIINHDHLSRHTINLSDAKNGTAMATFLSKTLTKQKTDLILIIPSPGDKIDRAMLNCQVQDLYPSVINLLNP